MPTTKKNPDDRGQEDASVCGGTPPAKPGAAPAADRPTGALCAREGLGTARPPKGGLLAHATGTAPPMSSPRTTAELAYLGDAVFELLVREKLLCDGVPFRKITRRAKDFVSAPAQAAMYHKVFDRLTDEERAIAKRGRNLHSTSRAKNAAVSEYRHATGLEAVFGFLHNKGDAARLAEIFEMCVSE
ncbi:MAG: hypothetical protein FWF77_07975 [Defluviitaleaceae bacterium]|nr:hypothetical protein [Defluviitaleaceae bacterium]